MSERCLHWLLRRHENMAPKCVLGRIYRLIELCSFSLFIIYQFSLCVCLFILKLNNFKLAVSV